MPDESTFPTHSPTILPLLDKKKFQVELVSPRNHFLFTPLLPSTAVGTLEFRAIQEPVRTIPNLSYYQATVDSIDVKNGSLSCIDAFHTGHHFNLKYDALILAAGCETATFNVPGVIGNDRVFFLKQLKDARNIRNRLIDCFERASSPACTPEEKKRLLTFVVVGGGPTSVEFASELYDFLKKDVSRWYPDLHNDVHIHLVEASGHILGTFNSKLVSYVERLFQNRQIHLMTSTAVAKVDGNEVIFADGTKLHFGLMVWSTGIKQLSMIQNIQELAKFPNGRLKVDGYLRTLTATATTTTTAATTATTATTATAAESSNSDNVTLSPHSRVFSVGDCAGNYEKPLPGLAQVASQQGIYLSAALNKYGLERVWNASIGKNNEPDVFKYGHLGAMASVGEWKGVYDSTNVSITSTKTVTGPPVTGFGK